MNISVVRLRRSFKALPKAKFSSVQSVQLCPTLCDPINYSLPGFSVYHYLPEFVQTHVHWVNDAKQASHPLSPPSPLALNFSQHQGLFQWVSSSHQVIKILELQHQSFQWIFRVEFLYNWLLWIFPSIMVFSNKSVLCIRWPKYWRFSFSISPSNEYSGLISLRT